MAIPFRDQVEQIKGHVQNVIKCPKKCDHRYHVQNVIILITKILSKFENLKIMQFLQRNCFGPSISSDAAKLAAKKALSKLSNPVECKAFLITKYVITDH
ncbi:hypothetical protein BpHYR1_035059 [Brachionus plicatilis]|uniref:Uncharacterized protein n=1 Tax=Brachionus plicatilis TaxID=10195 RepID=A0A3M7SZH0_BRAPC|nr:hypothetical protein BpHYR1_035059 [Brachionus plicatilis]